MEEDLRAPRARGNSMSKGPVVRTWLAAWRSNKETCGDSHGMDRQGKEDSPSHIDHWDLSLCWMSEPRSFWKGLAERQHACPHVCPSLT